MRLKYPFDCTFIDYPDNESCAVIIYIMGCENSCNGCHNIQFKDYDYSIGTKEMEVNEIVNELIIACNRNRTDKIVISGGECLSKRNIETTKQILEKMFEKYKISLYTSYGKYYIIENEVKGFTFVKSGLYDVTLKQESKKTNDYIMFASKNQILYDENLNQLSNEGIYYFN